MPTYVSQEEYDKIKSKSLLAAVLKFRVMPSADSIRKKYGIADLGGSEFAPDTDELKDLARNGLGGALRGQIASQGSSLVRSVTDQFASGMSDQGIGYGGIISAGLMNRYAAMEESAKISGFGEIVSKSLATDAQTREGARNALFSFLLNKQAADTGLVMQELQLRAQLKK